MRVLLYKNFSISQIVLFINEKSRSLLGGIFSPSQTQIFFFIETDLNLTLTLKKNVTK